MKTISINELSEIIGTINKFTLQIYLSNYKFNKFRKYKREGINARFELSLNFLNTLYTYLWYKNRVKDAENLTKYFSDYNLKVLSYEEFVE